jgi:hypothetical protein
MTNATVTQDAPPQATPPQAGPPRTPLALKLLAIPAVVVTLLVGLWLIASVIAPSYWTSIAGGVAWFVVVSLVLGRIYKGRPDLKLPLRGTFLLAAAAAAFAFYWTSIREEEVNEQVVTGEPADRAGGGDAGSRGEGGGSAQRSREKPAGNVQVASGTVESLAHSGEGNAAVVKLAQGGRKLTLTEFDIDPGPEVKVYLAAGQIAGDRDVDDFVDLGDLKGSKGNQQYSIPDDVDIDRYKTVVFWCVPFTQALAKSELKPS